MQGVGRRAWGGVWVVFDVGCASSRRFSYPSGFRGSACGFRVSGPGGGFQISVS